MNVISMRNGYLLFLWLAFLAVNLFTEFTLVPWDTSIVVLKSAHGSAQSTISLNVLQGVRMSFAIVLLSIGLSFYAVRRNPNSLTRLVLIHALFVPLLIIVGRQPCYIMAGFSPLVGIRFQSAAGFHRSILPMTTVAIACIIWFRQHLRAAMDTRLTALMAKSPRSIVSIFYPPSSENRVYRMTLYFTQTDRGQAAS